MYEHHGVHDALLWRHLGIPPSPSHFRHTFLLCFPSVFGVSGSLGYEAAKASNTVVDAQVLLTKMNGDCFSGSLRRVRYCTLNSSTVGLGMPRAQARALFLLSSLTVPPFLTRLKKFDAAKTKRTSIFN